VPKTLTPEHNPRVNEGFMPPAPSQGLNQSIGGKPIGFSNGVPNKKKKTASTNVLDACTGTNQRSIDRIFAKRDQRSTPLPTFLRSTEE